MNAVTTDGPYGRELLQFVMKTKLPTDSVLERYRASICVDHGDWDGLDLAGHGLTNKDIAVRLSLSPHTIARHLSNARAKPGAANRAEAAETFEEMQV